MEGTAETAGAVVGAVAAGAEGAVVSTAPVAAATAEGAAVGAVAAAAPAAVETGAASAGGVAEVAPVAVKTGAEGVATAAETSEAAVAQVAVEDVGESATDLLSNVAGGTAKSADDPADVVARRIVNEGLVEAQKAAEAARADPTMFTEARTLGRGGKLTKGEADVPEAVQKEHVVDYDEALEAARTAAASRGEDPNSPSIQRDALDRFYYGLAARTINERPRIMQEIMRGAESLVYVAAEIEAERLIQLRRAKGKDELTPEELDRWKLAIYLEMIDRKKKKSKGLKQAIAGALVGIVKEAFVTSAEPVKEELTAQPRRR